MKISLYFLILLLLAGVPFAYAEGPLNQRLIDASEAGELAIVQKLLKEGASVNAKSGRGKTPLMFAAAEGQLEVIEVLLEYGADPFAVDLDGDPAANHAAQNDHPEAESRLRAAMN